MQENNYIISFLRSGQHLTRRLIEFYCQEKNIDFSYCEFYTCCKTSPCKHNSLYQKNHDFRGTFPINNEDKYLVLYRSNFLEQCEAYYRYTALKKDIRPDGSTISGSNKNIRYDKSNKSKLYKSIINNGSYYMTFISKWVLNDKANILKLDYDKIIDNPYLYTQAIEFFYGDKDSVDIIEKFQKIENIERQHIIDFNFNENTGIGIKK